MALLTETTSQAVIIQLKSQFARHGVPDELISDNGPQFSSIAFQEFAKSWNFKHITSSPRYPRSNGLAERTVQTIKYMLKKANLAKMDPYKALLELRNTPIEDIGASPSQLLFSRRTQSMIPIKLTQLEPKVVQTEHVKSTLEGRQMVQSRYYNQHVRPLPPLLPGDVVRVQNMEACSCCATVQSTQVIYCGIPGSTIP